MARISGETLRALRRSRDWDVPRMARELRSAAGAEQVPSHASLIRQIRGWESGDHEISERYELLYLKALGIPGTWQDAPQDEGDPVRRHDFLALAGAATAGALTGLLAGDLPGGQLDMRRAPVAESTAASLTAITGAQRKLEATTPARDLAGSAIAHAGTAQRMLARAVDSPQAPEIAAALSEAFGLAAWLHADMTDNGSARACYRLAVQAASRA